MTPRPWLRRGLFALAGVLGAVVVLVAFAHTPFVRARVLASAIARLDAAGLVLTSSRLSYNLLTLEARLAGVRLAARGAATPFFSADDVRVKLGWPTLWGAVTLSSIEIDRPRLTIVRDASGATNLPSLPESGGSNAPFNWNALNRVIVRDLSVRYDDAAIPMAVASQTMTLDAARAPGGPLAGTLTSQGEATIRAGARETRVTALDGRLALDRSVLSFATLDVAATEGQLHLDGRLDLTAPAHPLDLRYLANTDLGRLAPWLGLKQDAPTGAIALSGKVAGPMAEPTLTVDAAGDALRWAPVGAVSLRSHAVVTSSRATVESFRATLAGGEVTGTATMPFAKGTSAEARAEWRNLDVGGLVRTASPPVRIASRSDGEASVAWATAALSAVRGRVAADFRADTAPARAVPVAGRLDLQFGDGRWTLVVDETSSGIATMTGTAEGRLGNEWSAATLGGQVKVNVEDVRSAGSGLTASGYLPAGDGASRTIAAMRGSAVAVIDLSGTIGAPRANGRLDARDLRVDTYGPGSMEATFDATRARVAVDAFRLSVGPNVIAGDAVVRLDTKAITGKVAGELPQLGLLTSSLPAEWKVEGNGRVDATLGGTLEAPQLTGTLDLTRLNFGDYQAGAVHADLALDGQRLSVQSRVPSANAAITGAVNIQTRQFTVDGTLDQADLARLSQQMLDVQGTLTMHVTAAGDLNDVAGTVRADADVSAASAIVEGIALRLDRSARAHYERERLTVESFDVRSGSSTMSVRGELGSAAPADRALDVAVKGSVEDFLPLTRFLPAAAGLKGSGAVDLSARASGALATPAITGRLSLTEGSIAMADLPAATGIGVEATYASGVVELANVHAAWQGATVSASGRLPLGVLGSAIPQRYLASLPRASGSAHADIEIASVTPEALTPWVGRDVLDRLTGRIDARAVVEATAFDARHVTGDIILSRAELELARVPIGQARPTRLRLADGRVDVVDWSWTGAGNRLDVSGGVELSGPSPRLDVGLAGSLDLRMLGAFTTDVAALGRATLDVRATGTTADPVLNGQLSLAGVDVRVRYPRLALTDLNGTATLTSNTIRLNDVTGRANGGTVQADGTLEYRNLQVSGGTLAIHGRGLALEIPDDLRTEVDADLTLVSSGGAPTLGGQVTIVRGSYRRPISLTEQFFARATKDLTPPEGSPPGALDRIQLNVAIVSAEDVIVDNNYARAAVGANLRIGGTIGEPVITGRLTAQEGGEVYLSGRTYELQRGAINFTNPTRIEPDLDLSIETRVQSYDVTLAISGTPENLDVSLQSPGRSQEDAISLLLTGQLAKESSFVQTDVARGQLLMLLSGEFLGFAGRAVGLDAVQVSRGLGGAASDFDLLASNTDPSARLTATKNLRGDVQIVVSQSLRESDDTTWILNYQPVRPVQLRATTEGGGRRSYEFRHELALAQSPPAFGAAPGSREPPVERRVSSVTFSGSPGESEADLRRVLDLTAGDRFDFYRWQRDQDRLAEWYHARGFLEARIRARRREAENPATDHSVALLYDVDSGPRATLNVTGFALPGAVIARMKQAWSDAVFDGFLLDDLQDLARNALVDDGYLQADVTAAVASAADPNVKAIDVRIAPGTRFDQRRIVFSGNRRVATDELLAAVQLNLGGGAAWRSPETLKTTLERYYRSRGHLAVAVTPEAPVFSGSSATLPVQIAEGEPFLIARVEIEGASKHPAEELRTATGLSVGSTYLASQVEPARRRIETTYLRDGYNAVRVSAATRVDRDHARVDVVLSVVEGPQQVLVGIEVKGAKATTTGTVERTAALAVGSPADLNQVYGAQKRLYDTGVFQRADVALEPAAPAGEPAPAVQPVKAVVSLQELPRYRFRYGFRLTDEVGPVEATRETRPALVADLLRRNFLGRAISAGIAGQIERDQRLARAIVSLPGLFHLPVVTSLYATSSRQFFPAASEFDIALVERVTEFTAEQRFRPSARMAVTYGYRFARKHNFEAFPDPDSVLPPQDIATKTARVTGTYAWDTRDDPSDAHRGWLHSSGFEFGSRAFGSDLRFIRYLAQQYYFRSVDRGVVFGSALRLGVGRGFGGQQLIDNYKTGGGTTVRGFAEKALGESDFFGPLGGEALLVMNQEIRFPVFRWFRGVGFIDAGNVFARPRDLSFGDLEVGGGFGLRVHSPFALFRLDFGVPLTRRDLEPRGRWYLGIGQSF